MKRWLSRKVSFIFEASPSTNQACFMTSLCGHSIGGLYCLYYCLFETQPFKPPFKIYFSLGELKRLKNLILHAKAKSTKVASTLVKSMLERNMFLFRFVDTNEGSLRERVNELRDIQIACIQAAQKKYISILLCLFLKNLMIGLAWLFYFS
ncbi:hypothetical protein M9H77_02170 [Catharanthus roseus]|uniref:Uncharacterized protein n=1 Tax=Catharanthus roseus TaxID=4058 RepID=A0ACC0C816_CATRO|nr:hypothetical protein M9H77_02170 [Catharanthus roseus]